jgi:CarD family transcriptional regulator
MTFSIGRKVVYPGQGPCRIGAVVKKVIGGQAGSYYPLVSLAELSEAVLVPVNKIDGLGIRPLMTKAEVAGLLKHLAVPAQRITNWKQRDFVNLKRLSSGSVDDLAEIIQSLTELNSRRPLAPRERQILDRARRMLICEISESTGESKCITEEYLDSALGADRAR